MVAFAREARRNACSLLRSIDSKEYIKAVLQAVNVIEDDPDPTRRDPYLSKLKLDASDADKEVLTCARAAPSDFIPEQLTLDALSRRVDSLRSTSVDDSDIDLINLDLLRRRKEKLEALCSSREISKIYGEHILSAWRDIFNEITILIIDLYKLGYKKIPNEITITEFTNFFKQLHDSQLQDELLSYLEQAVRTINQLNPQNPPLCIAQRPYSEGFVFFFYSSAQLTEEPTSSGTSRTVIKTYQGLEEDLFHITIHTGDDPLSRGSDRGKIHTTRNAPIDARAKFNRRVNLYPILLAAHTPTPNNPGRLVQLIPYYPPAVVNNAFVRKCIPFILGSINEFLYLAQMRKHLTLSGFTSFIPHRRLPVPIHIRVMRPPPRQTQASASASASAFAPAPASAPAPVLAMMASPTPTPRNLAVMASPAPRNLAVLASHPPRSTPAPACIAWPGAPACVSAPAPTAKSATAKGKTSSSASTSAAREKPANPFNALENEGEEDDDDDEDDDD